LRLARGVTGRDDVIKFEGGYHGHTDGMLVNAGSGALTFGTPSSPGVPEGYTRHTFVCDYNDPDSAAAVLKERDVAAVIVEPVSGNMGVVPPAPGFLESLREHCTAHGAMLIFDEVITGFRVSYAGAQGHFGVSPDITTLGKIIGGGMPVGAYGASQEIMGHLSPEGPVYQAGTLSGNPVTCTAGSATLKTLHRLDPYGELEAKGARLEAGLLEAASAAGVSVRINRFGSGLTMFFTETEVRCFADLAAANSEVFGRFFHGCLDRGVYLPPSPFEAWFLSTTHGLDEIDRTIEVVREVFALGGF
jgi:glutamate-1-semialdehyde 2,1-aminomutase